MGKRIYKFNEKDRNLDDFEYIYSLDPKVHKKFDLREDCIANYSEDDPNSVSYVSIITKKKYKTGTRVSTKCSFTGSGAPLIVFTNDINRGEDGTLFYGLQFECVAHRGGCNIWRIVPAPGKRTPIRTVLASFVKFPIEEGSVVDLSATIEEENVEWFLHRRKLTISINGVVFGCIHEDLPEEFHVGITGCESKNKFYELMIED